MLKYCFKTFCIETDKLKTFNRTWLHFTEFFFNQELYKCSIGSFLVVSRDYFILQLVCICVSLRAELHVFGSYVTVPLHTQKHKKILTKTGWRIVKRINMIKFE